MVDGGGGQVPSKISEAQSATATKSANWRYSKKFSWLKRVLFFDVDGLIYLGYRTRLEPEHMYPAPAVSTDLLINQLEPAWKEQLSKPRPDLKRALLRGNVGYLLFTGLLYGISQACSLAGPLLLRRIVQGLQCQSYQSKAPIDIGCEPKTKLYYYIIGLFLAPAIQSVCENQQNYLLYLTGTRMRNALMAAIYRKCLRLSNAALQAESTGKVVTLMSNDAQKLQDAMFAIHAMWGSPAFIIAVLVLLWFEVGWATFVGLGVMLVMVPLTGTLAAKLGMLRRSILQWTDKRVGRMNELISGIQMIKFYAWEESFRSAVQDSRGQEAIILRHTAKWQGVFGLLLFYGPVAVALFCFGSWTIAGRELTPAKAYTALALFSLLRFPMSFLPMLISMIINALVAIKRIEGFLRRDEAALEPWDAASLPAGHVSITDGVFAWDVAPPADAAAAGPPGKEGKESATADKKSAAAAKKAAKKAAENGKATPPAPAVEAAALDGDSHQAGDAAEKAANEEKAEVPPQPEPERPTLEGVNLVANPGSLTMVVGSVGSGKSSLLSALIGHIGRRGGKVALGGSIAYVAQTAWIMNDTVQENVLLGQPLDPERYRTALQVSQLGPDLAILPNGDLTEIGDRGVTLSGGQKQRVSIARAVYSNADVYLLDDPLSAVDSHVGRALFEQVIRGVLRSKTVILVTNALQYLPQADTVMWMEGGRVRAAGTFAQVQEAGLNIAQLCHDHDHDHDQPPKEPHQGDEGKGEAEGSNTTGSGKTAEERSSGGKGHAAGRDGKAGQGVTLTRQATDANRNLTGIEVRESGAISGHVIALYFKAGGGWMYFGPLLLLVALEQGARVYTDTWVGNWFGNKYNKDNWWYLGIYFMLGVVYGIFTFVRATMFLFFCVRSAVSIHNQLLDHILALPKSFFDTNPAGRILNRFSRDTDIMDSTLAASLIQFAGSVATYISILVVITIATPWFGVALLPLTVIYFTIQRYYIPAARELQRIESISRSPIYSRFAEALAGVSTIRAYRAEERFTVQSDGLMERNAHSFVTQKLAAGWLACRLDMLGLAVLTLCGALCIQGGIDPGMAGLALVYALDLTRFLKHGTNMASKSEADFNSVERIAQYLTPEREARPDTPPDVAGSLPSEWPHSGAITVDNLCMRYRPGMPLVLQGISFSVQAGEKVGLVGRTGSGKSSLLLALFRMVEAESGVIAIDGVDIAKLGLRHLRSKLSIIPQDPFMFSGTVRHNLDPFSTLTDKELWQAIDAVGLRPAISALEDKLQAKVVDGGANFSLGQRQLFCLARAMLRKSRVLMLDEATASVDVDTDAAIQDALRITFGDATCLTIAHRLNTIMDADRVVVLEAGKVVEDGEPAALLARQEGLFTSMVDQTGKNSSRYLKTLARSAASLRAEGQSNGVPRAVTLERIRGLFNTTTSFAAVQPIAGSQSKLADMDGEGAADAASGIVDIRMAK